MCPNSCHFAQGKYSPSCGVCRVEFAKQFLVVGHAQSLDLCTGSVVIFHEDLGADTWFISRNYTEGYRHVFRNGVMWGRK